MKLSRVIWSRRPRSWPWPLLIRRVQGQSMSPVLEPGDLVIGCGWLRQISKGSLVIIRHEGIEKIKRISYVGSSSIEVLGDNPSSSTDSRQFGRIPKEVVMARVVYIFKLKRKVSLG